MKTNKINLINQLVGCGLIAAAFASSFALAGNSSGGGGDAIVCNKNGKERVYLADTFESFRNGKLAQIPNVREEVYTEALLRTISRADQALGKKISDAVEGLKFKDSYSNTGLLPELFPKFLGGLIGELNNDHLAITDSDCKKQQLAIQNISKKSVKVERNILDRMTALERGVFRVHEGAIYVRKAVLDTTPVRNEIRKFVESPEFAEHVLKVSAESPDASREKKLKFLKNALIGVSEGIALPMDPSAAASYFADAFRRVVSGSFSVYIPIGSDLLENVYQKKMFGREGADKGAEFLIDYAVFPDEPVKKLPR